MPRRYAIIGAGNGGLALAGHLLLHGEQVALYDVDPAAIAPLANSGYLDIGGAFGEHRLALTAVSSDLGATVAEAEVVVLVTPASAHRAVALALAPLLRGDQVVLLMPGRTGGALEFRTTLREAGCTVPVLIGETQTLPYAARKTSPTSVQIYALKHRVLVAALPAASTPHLVESFPALSGVLWPAPSVLETSLGNVGMIFHPIPTVLNAGRIEDTQGQFEYYHQGITESVARVMEQVDAERCAVAAAMGARVPSVQEWLHEVYGVEANSLWEAIHRNAVYAGILAPPTLQSRYLTEDVATGLVPLVELGSLVGVATPVSQAIVMIASGLLGTDFAHGGRTLARMGLEGLLPAAAQAAICG